MKETEGGEAPRESSRHDADEILLMYPQKHPFQRTGFLSFSSSKTIPRLGSVLSPVMGLNQLCGRTKAESTKGEHKKRRREDALSV